MATFRNLAPVQNGKTQKPADETWAFFSPAFRRKNQRIAVQGRAMLLDQTCCRTNVEDGNVSCSVKYFVLLLKIVKRQCKKLSLWTCQKKIQLHQVPEKLICAPGGILCHKRDLSDVHTSIFPELSVGF